MNEEDVISEFEGLSLWIDPKLQNRGVKEIKREKIESYQTVRYGWVTKYRFLVSFPITLMSEKETKVEEDKPMYSLPKIVIKYQTWEYSKDYETGEIKLRSLI